MIIILYSVFHRLHHTLSLSLSFNLPVRCWFDTNHCHSINEYLANQIIIALNSFSSAMLIIHTLLYGNIKFLLTTESRVNWIWLGKILTNHIQFTSFPLPEFCTTVNQRISIINVLLS